MDADSFFEGLVISPVKLSEAVSLRRLYPAQGFPRNIADRGDLIVADKDLLIVGHGSHAVSILFAFFYNVCQNGVVHKRTDSVMDDYDIIFRADSFQVIDAVADGFLSGLPSGNHPFQFVDPELLRVGPGDVVPAVDADQLDGVDLRMLLEALQGIDQNRLIIDVDKLLRDILSHPVPAAPGDNQCNIHTYTPSPFSASALSCAALRGSSSMQKDLPSSRLSEAKKIRRKMSYCA